jgi:hypothetical protein
MEPSAARIKVEILLNLIDQGYDHEAWHGPNLRGSIARVKAIEAEWRPAEEQHNIWEIVVHCAYWKYVVWRRLAQAVKGSFPRKGSDWIPRPAPKNPQSWSEDLELLHSIHAQMRDLVSSLTDEQLDYAPEGSSVTNYALISGVALHDVYHAGQIQQLRQAYKWRAI